MPHSPTVDKPPAPPPLSRANSVVSLYQSCLNLIERLSGVPDFEQYLDPELLLRVQAGSPTTMSVNDPVSQLWILFRLGAPLACIFNGLRPNRPLKINNTDTISLSNINPCKASVFHFLVACLQELQFKDDDLFTISELYQDDTNGFVKVKKKIASLLMHTYTHTLSSCSLLFLLPSICTAPHKDKHEHRRCYGSPDHDNTPQQHVQTQHHHGTTFSLPQYISSPQYLPTSLPPLQRTLNMQEKRLLRAHFLSI